MTYGLGQCFQIQSSHTPNSTHFFNISNSHAYKLHTCKCEIGLRLELANTGLGYSLNLTNQPTPNLEEIKFFFYIFPVLYNHVISHTT